MSQFQCTPFRGHNTAAASAASVSNEIESGRKRSAPVIEWDLNHFDAVHHKTIVDERWIERLNIVLSSGSEVNIKAGSNEMGLEKMSPAAPSNSLTTSNAYPDDQQQPSSSSSSGAKKKFEDLAAPKKISELYLKRKYSQIWPGLSKHFAVLHSKDNQKSYRPQYKTIIDLDTFNQIFGDPEQADRVSKMLTHKLNQLTSRWNELYSSDDPEVRARRSPIYLVIPITSHESVAETAGRYGGKAACKSHLVLVLSNYCWVREQQNNTGVAIVTKDDFYVSLKMASTSFRYSEQSEELEKIHGYLYDSNGFSLIYRDFKELLADRKLTYIFGPTVNKRYKEDLDFESSVEQYQASTAEAQAKLLEVKQKRRDDLKRKICLGKKRLFSAFENIDEDEDEVEHLLLKAAEHGPSTPPPPLPASSPIPLTPPEVESSIPLPDVQIQDESRF